MTIDFFESHLSDPAPGFWCHAALDRSETVKHLAKVTHAIRSPASSKTLASVQSTLGTASDAVTHFLRLHDGVTLYADSKSDAAGFDFFCFDDWENRTAEMRESFSEMGFDEPEMPSWFADGLVFCEVPQSGNSFVVQTAGGEQGSIFYADHDDFNAEPFAANFDEFLRLIVEDPSGLMLRCGCYTRYSDGVTETQWIPKQYVPDCTKC